ncbi:MAG TPA: pitrilysin family protein [Spirochaetota bacterium]|nr:pitrilysin family protein [Spirochaetota bacterium]
MKFKNLVPMKAAAVFMVFCCALFMPNPGSGSADSIMPDVKSFILDNGVKVFSIDDDLPRTEIVVSISYGKLFEDMNNAGMSEVIANTLLLSGSAKYPGDSVISTLESAGGSISVDAGWESITIEVRVLERHTDLAFDIIGDLLADPLFNSKTIKYSANYVYEKNRRRMDDPAAKGMAALRSVIFNGKGYGADITKQSISSISENSVKDIWNRHTTGGNIIVSVSSSLGSEGIGKLCRKSFSALKKGTREYYSADMETVRSQVSAKSRNIYFIPADFDQATIICGVTAPDVKYKGNYAIEVMNYILGGGSFGSRLMTEIREKRGLAYCVFSYVAGRYSTGLFLCFAQTRNEEAGNVLSLMNANISRMYSEPVPADELAWAKNSIINSYVFTFSKVSQILAAYFTMEYYSLEPDYYTRYTSRIAAVTAEEIADESRKLFANGLVTVVVGKKEIEKELSKYGNVIIIEEKL